MRCKWANPNRSFFLLGKNCSIFYLTKYWLLDQYQLVSTFSTSHKILLHILGKSINKKNIFSDVLQVVIYLNPLKFQPYNFLSYIADISIPSPEELLVFYVFTHWHCWKLTNDINRCAYRVHHLITIPFPHIP